MVRSETRPFAGFVSRSVSHRDARKIKVLSFFTARAPLAEIGEKPRTAGDTARHLLEADRDLQA
jgi:hypothetical protein